MASIREKGMMIKLSISQWSGTKTDKNVSNDIMSRHHAKPGSGNFSKKLVDSNLLSDFRAVATQAQQYHNSMTMPWLDGGWRILPSNMYFEYIKEMGNYKDTANEIVSRIGQRRPKMLDEARERLGSMFDEKDFPSAEELQNKFGIEMSIMPVPMADDFRADISQSEQDRLRESVEKEVQANVETAVRDIWTRAYSAINHLYEQLANEDKRVMQASFDALKKLSHTIPKFNIFGDEELNKIAARMQDSLAQYQADGVRKDESMRNEAKKEAREILDTMQSYFKSA